MSDSGVTLLQSYGTRLGIQWGLLMLLHFLSDLMSARVYRAQANNSILPSFNSASGERKWIGALLVYTARGISLSDA